MKLVHPHIERKIVFDEEHINILCIENKKMFISIVEELLEQAKSNDGRFVLSDEKKDYEFKKWVETIPSPFLIDFSNKKFINKVINDLSSISFDSEFYPSTVDLFSKVQEWLLSLADQLTYDIDITDELDEGALIKSLGVHLSYDEETLLTRLTDYVCLCNEILKSKLIILFNIHDLFTESELELFYKTVLGNKINVLIIESRSYDRFSNIENYHLIDNDLCEII